ncbi:uncharacterized protein TRIADDRAFT_51454 [Trichoplax adhaerens]|uniref:Peptidase C1A papain C-terminal domain-containing protein n=1 Tax=Trichoplax adhaerens TaxID=10228 RepID=B3RJ93_TRIAD|nr:hypothetical protein TRIADDRAFT_51454 [Trichoplax adhaerens]EDV28493.1 hypothetical protein TRIADDRAFT_51454 [Trichoplax adhaerens]|eukprot:XP_002107695.1 hypothetical protein TRIADDRAFT_51454 [Trichoplax adhaerens]
MTVLPQNPLEYRVKGKIRLPYANVVEPFEAWYSATLGKSLISYFSGMDTIFNFYQPQSHGVIWEICPIPRSDGIIKQTCLGRRGTRLKPIRAQPFIPNFQQFHLEKQNIYYRHTFCDKWTWNKTILHKINRYTFYTKHATSIPIQLIMFGYNNLFHNHYDHYIIDYEEYEGYQPHQLRDEKIFQLPNNIPCRLLSSKRLYDHHYQQQRLINSMQSLIPAEQTIDDPVDSLFHQFTHQYNKTYRYRDHHQHAKRQNYFRQHLRFIQSTNRKGLKYQLKLNHFADRSDKELWNFTQRHFKLNYGKLEHDVKNFITRYKLPFALDLNQSIADHLDWRDRGAISKIRDQGMCSSCWALSTTQAIESALYIQTGEKVELSSQSLVDCSWPFGNQGCSGGFISHTLAWIIKQRGIPTKSSYGQYLGRNGYCHHHDLTTGAKLKGYSQIPQGNMKALKVALAKVGPVTVSINTSPKSFLFYSSGVFYNDQCLGDYAHLDHNVLAIGYGRQHDQDYILIKNSWSAYWGDHGYIKISTRNNNCGLATNAYYPILALNN